MFHGARVRPYGLVTSVKPGTTDASSAIRGADWLCTGRYAKRPALIAWETPSPVELGPNQSSLKICVRARRRERGAVEGRRAKTVVTNGATTVVSSHEEALGSPR